MFPVNSVKFLGTIIFIEHLWWLLLEISSFSEMPYERCSEKHKFIYKLMKTSSGGVLLKDALKGFAKSTGKYLCGNLFLKLQTGNLKLSETVTGDVQ